MTDEIEEEIEYRYIFLVRMPVGFDRNAAPTVDSFYQLTVPPGITGEQAKVMTVLNPNFCKEQINKDGHAMKGMSLRMRFNQDMYQKICLVRTESPISAEDLDNVIAMKYRENTLEQFLKEAAIAT